MNVLSIKGNRLCIDNIEIEDWEYHVEDGILYVKGNQVIEGFFFGGKTDKDLLDMVRPEYIQTSWPLKRKYVQGYFEYKKTKPIQIRSSTFMITERP